MNEKVNLRYYGDYDETLEMFNRITQMDYIPELSPMARGGQYVVRCWMEIVHIEHLDIPTHAIEGNILTVGKAKFFAGP
jgi:hypothetical protein